MPSVSGPCEVSVGEGTTAFTVGRDQQFEDATLSVERMKFDLKTQASDAPDDYTKTGIKVGLTLSISDASSLSMCASAFNTGVQGAVGSQYIALSDDAGKGYTRQRIIIKPYLGDALSPPENWWIIPAAAAVADGAFEAAFGLTTQRNFNFQLVGLGSTLSEKIFTMPDEVRAMAGRATAAGSSISAATQGYFNTFIRGVMADGMWDRVYDVGSFAGAGLNAALLKLDSLPGVQTNLTNGGFGTSDYSEAGGLTGDGSTKYLSTGFNPAAAGMDKDDIHICVMTKNIATQGADIELSVGTTTTARLQLSTGSFTTPNTSAISHIADSTTTNLSVTGQPAATGANLCVIGSRVSSTDHRLYSNGSQIGTTNTGANAGTLPNGNILLMTGLTSGGVNTNFSRKKLLFYSIGRGLTVAQVAAYYARINTLQTALGR